MAIANNVLTEQDFQELEQNLPDFKTNQQVELEPEPQQEKKKNYCCDACGKRYTQLNSLKRHRKYSCKNLETERLPKESCPECGKMLHKTTVYKHKKMAVRNQSRKILIKQCDQQYNEMAEQKRLTISATTAVTQERMSTQFKELEEE